MAVLAGQRATAAQITNPRVADLTLGSISNTLSESVIGSAVIPANDAATNSGYGLRVVGTADTTATPTLNLQVRLTGASGSLIFTMGTLTCRTGTGFPYVIDVWWYFTAGGAGGSFTGGGYFAEALASATRAIHPTASAAIAADATSNITLVVTATWGTASTSNICRTLGGSLFRT